MALGQHSKKTNPPAGKKAWQNGSGTEANPLGHARGSEMADLGGSAKSLGQGHSAIEWPSHVFGLHNGSKTEAKRKCNRPWSGLNLIPHIYIYIYIYRERERFIIDFLYARPLWAQASSPYSLIPVGPVPHRD